MLVGKFHNSFYNRSISRVHHISWLLFCIFRKRKTISVGTWHLLKPSYSTTGLNDPPVWLQTVGTLRTTAQLFCCQLLIQNSKKIALPAKLLAVLSFYVLLPLSASGKNKWLIHWSRTPPHLLQGVRPAGKELKKNIFPRFFQGTILDKLYSARGKKDYGGVLCSSHSSSTNL